MVSLAPLSDLVLALWRHNPVSSFLLWVPLLAVLLLHVVLDLVKPTWPLAADFALDPLSFRNLGLSITFDSPLKRVRHVF